MRVLVTGGAGFVGSNLAERLLAEGCEVTALDNFSRGSRENLRACTARKPFRVVSQDLLDREALPQHFQGYDAVFHLAANSDILAGIRQTDTDLRLGTLATANVLEAMRLAGVRQIVFSSSSVVYGEPRAIPTPRTTARSGPSRSTGPASSPARA